jgi:general secretion pathway protein C
MNIQHVIALINMILLTTGAYLGVGYFYQVVGLRVVSPQNAVMDPSIDAFNQAMVDRPLNYYSPILERDLFKTQKAPQTPVAKENVALENLEETSLKLKLWGTVSGDPERAYAVIEDTQKREQNLFRVGDSIQSAQVKMILREKVVLTVAGKDEVLAMEKVEQGPGSGRPGFAARSSMQVSPTSELNTDAPVRAQRISLRRDMINDAMQDVTKLMTEIAVRPHMEDGQAAGLALTNIKPNSVFRRMGLRNGDVLVGVGGQEIRSVDDALQLYESLKSSDDVAVQLKRRGQERTINYNIR